MTKLEIWRGGHAARTYLVLYDAGAGGAIEQFFGNFPTGYIGLSDEELRGLTKALLVAYPVEETASE